MSSSFLFKIHSLLHFKCLFHSLWYSHHMLYNFSTCIDLLLFLFYPHGSLSWACVWSPWWSFCLFCVQYRMFFLDKCVYINWVVKQQIILIWTYFNLKMLYKLNFCCWSNTYYCQLLMWLGLLIIVMNLASLISGLHMDENINNERLNEIFNLVVPCLVSWNKSLIKIDVVIAVINFGL